MTWKDRLGDRIPAELGREIDTFENQIALKRQGRIDDKVFAETRLRRGAYGQRYDNGQRNDGNGVKALAFPSNGLTKGPDTVWDAPGMQRIKIPFGGLNPDQMDTLADLAEEYSDGICHITTRQDVQLHFVHLDDTPALMRRLAAVGITTREACGNTVRNVTACPLAGVCRDETFDVTPYAQASMRFLLGHPDAQDFGRKFKVAFSGCRQHACGLVNMHDFGAIAATRETAGGTERGFEVYVGGGLGAVPHEARLFDPFMAEADVLPTLQAISRVFARLGEKRNRARARIKFLVAKLGIDEFRRLVEEERRGLAPRRALDGLARGPVVDGRAAAEGRRAPRRRAERVGLRGLVALERLPPAPAGSRGGDGEPAPRRHRRRSAPGARRRRPPVRRRHRPHHRRAEHRAAVGTRVGPAGAPSGAGRPRAGAARRTVDRRHHRLPRHRHLQARHRLVAGAGGRAREAVAANSSTPWTTRSAACASRSAGASTRAASTT